MWINLVLVCGCVMLCVAQSDKDVEQTEEFLLTAFDKGTDKEGGKSRSLEKFKPCDHEDGEDARCVKKSLCDENAPPLDPTTTFTYREMVEGGCTYLQTCCPESKIRTEPRKPKAAIKRGCGYSNPGANVLRELATKNGYADYGDFPWMIVLMKKGVPKEKFDEAYIGGGTLIDPSIVLTVAHKVDEMSASEVMCRAGEWDTKSEEEAFKHQDREVKQIIIHNEYLRQHAQYDVALIILKEPFDLDAAPHIGVACLEKKLPIPGTECFSMGWGKDFLNGDKYASILKKLNLPLVAADRCQNLYRNSQLGQSYRLHKSLTCAGGEANVDTCIGDGGSSLVCPIPDKSGLRYSVVGMVAYGLGCGKENLPGVYVKIPEVYDWVFKETVLQGFTDKLFVT
ncbi:phenoloxidase-activating factor 2-like [Vanessa atalanta]|uniref:phenoloxidase-activating factor 2-like n=1 Tax=Vanessa atalanta TaxID=42275 RepID=UPI001FCD68A3|nr:phenoloxidase-activating factor 2-like [Vanessa atalanta]